MGGVYFSHTMEEISKDEEEVRRDLSPALAANMYAKEVFDSC